MTNFRNLNWRLDLGRLRPYIAASIALFLLGAATGTWTFILQLEFAVQLHDVLKQFLGMFHGMSKLQLFAAIFLNNSLKTFLVVLLGPLLGIVPIFFVFMNGAMLGAVIPMSIAFNGPWFSLMVLLPHAIFELPAIFLGTSIGIKLGLHPLRRLAGGADSSLLSKLGNGLRLYVAIILPLLLVAALIEVFVTPLVAGV